MHHRPRSRAYDKMATKIMKYPPLIRVLLAEKWRSAEGRQISFLSSSLEEASNVVYPYLEDVLITTLGSRNILIPLVVV